jgi:hypothetical protein
MFGIGLPQQGDGQKRRKISIFRVGFSSIIYSFAQHRQTYTKARKLPHRQKLYRPPKISRLNLRLHLLMSDIHRIFALMKAMLSQIGKCGFWFAQRNTVFTLFF